MNAKVIPLPRTERPEPSGEGDVGSLFRRFAPYVASVAFRIMGRDDELEDIVQDVFVDAVQYHDTLREPAAVRGWLAAITVRAAARRLKRRRLRRLFGFDDATHAVAAKGASPEQLALLQQIYRVLDGFRADDRIAWTLRYMEGERLEDIAQICGCSLATVKRRIQAVEVAVEGVLRHG